MMTGASYIVFRYIFLVGITSAYQHAVFLEQLDGVSCLPGHRSQPDQILFQEVPGTEGCVPEDMVGIELYSGEFARRWKGVYLHTRSDMSSEYRPLIVHKESESPLTAIFSYHGLERHQVVCLWKDVDDLIGWSHTNVYYIRNSQDLLPGKMYRFAWLRDDSCVNP